MTKKTDSLIFRYGIQTLWKNTNFLFKTSLSTSFFFKFLYFELQIRNLELLSIEQKRHNLIYLFVFCFFFNSRFIELKNGCGLFLFKFILFYKYWFILKALYSIFFSLNTQRFFFFGFPYLLTLINTKNIVVFKSDYSYLYEVQTVNILFFKVEQLRLESFLSNFFIRHFKIKLHNIFNLPLYFDFINLFPSSNKTTGVNFTTLEFMLYLSCKLRVISIFSRYLAKSLELENRHRKILWSIIAAVTLLNKKLTLFKGIRIYVTGKLNGKMRRKTYSFKFGSVSTNKLSSRLDYFKASSFTKFGTISVKTWILFD